MLLVRKGLKVGMLLSSAWSFGFMYTQYLFMKVLRDRYLNNSVHPSRLKPEIALILCSSCGNRHKKSPPGGLFFMHSGIQGLAGGKTRPVIYWPAAGSGLRLSPL